MSLKPLLSRAEIEAAVTRLAGDEEVLAKTALGRCGLVDGPAPRLGGVSIIKKLGFVPPGV